MDMGPFSSSFSRNRRHPSLQPKKWPTIMQETNLEEAPPMLDDKEDLQIIDIAINEPVLATKNQTFWSKFTIPGLPPDSILLLNLVAIIWGSQHAVIKMCMSDLDPSTFSLVRFFLGAVIATPAWLLSSTSSSDKSDQKTMHKSNELSTTWRWGIEMGVWMFLGYAFQAMGLAVS